MPGRCFVLLLLIAMRPTVSGRGQFSWCDLLHTLEQDGQLYMAFKTDCTYNLKTTVKQY